jgi:hypothetical protein
MLVKDSYLEVSRYSRASVSESQWVGAKRWTRPFVIKRCGTKEARLFMAAKLTRINYQQFLLSRR